MRSRPPSFQPQLVLSAAAISGALQELTAVPQGVPGGGSSVRSQGRDQMCLCRPCAAVLGGRPRSDAVGPTAPHQAAGPAGQGVWRPVPPRALAHERGTLGFCVSVLSSCWRWGLTQRCWDLAEAGPDRAPRPPASAPQGWCHRCALPHQWEARAGPVSWHPQGSVWPQVHMPEVPGEAHAGLECFRLSRWGARGGVLEVGIGIRQSGPTARGRPFSSTLSSTGGDGSGSWACPSHHGHRRGWPR